MAASRLHLVTLGWNTAAAHVRQVALEEPARLRHRQTVTLFQAVGIPSRPTVDEAVRPRRRAAARSRGALMQVRPVYALTRPDLAGPHQSDDIRGRHGDTPSVTAGRLFARPGCLERRGGEEEGHLTFRGVIYCRRPCPLSNESAAGNVWAR